MTIYAITLRHPWSFAIARLGKDIENRTWKPPRHLIGQTIAIHGGAVPKGLAGLESDHDGRFIAQNIVTLEYYRALPKTMRDWLYQHGRSLSSWTVPGIVATALLAEVVTESDSPWFSGPFGFVLTDVMPLENPIPHRGALGFWEVERPVEVLLRDAYAKAHDGEVL